MKHYYTELEKAYINSFAVNGVISFDNYITATLDVLNADIGGYPGRSNAFIKWVMEQEKKGIIAKQKYETVTLISGGKI